MPLTPTQVIHECAKVSSTTAKQTILLSNTSDLLKKCLDYALNPYKVYGIKKFEINLRNPSGPAKISVIFDLCDKLIKRELTGDTARLYILALSGELAPENKMMLAWILEKDFKAGIGVTTVNKCFPKLIPEFDVQLAQPSKFLHKVVYPCLVQPKLDGVRVIALTNPTENSVEYYSRNGKKFENFGCFDKELLLMSNKESKMFDGEVVGPKGDDFRGIMEQVRRKYDVTPEGLSFYLFDWMPMHHFSRQHATLIQQDRTDYLDELEGTLLRYPHQRRVQIVYGVTCHNEAEVMRFYDTCVHQDGFEGVIIKDIRGEYDFKRSNVWIKLKPSITEDFKIVDIQEGDGKYKGLLGAVIIDVDGVKVNVGSGFKDTERISIESAQILIGKTIEVEYDAKTPDKSLRFPRFKRIREDK